MRLVHVLGALSAASLVISGLWMMGCGSSPPGFDPRGGGGGGEAGVDGGPIFQNGDGGGDGGCVNLQCNIKSCSGGTSTTVSGTVYDPAGNIPLYNVIVSVPNAPLSKFTEGVTCDRCGTTVSGSPITTALTGADGKFVLKDVPTGTN